jgi:hypothetical protein
MTESFHEHGGADERLAALRESVPRVFPLVAYHGPVTPYDGDWLAGLTEENAFLEDYIWLHEALHGRQWSEVPKDVVCAIPSELSLLTSEAVAAFLPAWILCSLENITGENEVREDFIYTFSPDGHPGLTDFQLSRLRALNSDQRSLIRSILVEFAHVEPSEFVRDHAAAAVKFIDDNFGHAPLITDANT